MTLSKFLTPIILCLSLSLSACGPEIIYKDRIQVLRPDPVWLQDCNIVGLEGPVVLDAIEQSRKHRKALEACNLDKQALRTWDIYLQTLEK